MFPGTQELPRPRSCRGRLPFLPVAAAGVGFEPQPSPRVIQAEQSVWGSPRWRLGKLSLSHRIYVHLCLTKCFTGVFPATLSPHAEFCRVRAVGRRGNAAFQRVHHWASSSHKRGTQMASLPLWLSSACYLGPVSVLVHFPSCWEELEVHQTQHSLLPSGFPCLYFRISDYSKTPWIWLQ